MSGKFTSKSELSKAKNFGAAHEGTHHWIMQRATAIALVPLMLWFVYSIVCLSSKSLSQIGEFFESGLNATLLSILIITSFYHAALGLQIVIEDYVSCHAKKIATLFIVKAGLVALGVTCVLAIVKLHLG